MGDKKERPKIEDVLDAVPTTCLVSGGEWTGVPLVELLKAAGVKPGVKSVHFVGYDTGRPDPTPQYAATGRTDIEVHDPGIINYDKALPLDKALHPDTMLAWAMNGEYLQHIHGAPLRLVVPGWSGNWSVKWLKEINLLDHTPACYYRPLLRARGVAGRPEQEPCTELGCKSIILYPIEEESPLPSGRQGDQGPGLVRCRSREKDRSKRRRRQELATGEARGSRRPVVVAPLDLPLGREARQVQHHGARYRREQSRGSPRHPGISRPSILTGSFRWTSKWSDRRGGLNIFVCIKEIQNPELVSDLFRVDEQRKEVIPVRDMPLVTSPFDEQAIEAALRIRDRGSPRRLPRSRWARKIARCAQAGALDGCGPRHPDFRSRSRGTGRFRRRHHALQAIEKSGPFDLILTDARRQTGMPELSGAEWASCCACPS
jgi:DMSO/TMAO reductase YedYZ molybdopterin-dependent catalytic subunit